MSVISETIHINPSKFISLPLNNQKSIIKIHKSKSINKIHNKNPYLKFQLESTKFIKDPPKFTKFIKDPIIQQTYTTNNKLIIGQRFK